MQVIASGGDFGAGLLNSGGKIIPVSQPTFGLNVSEFVTGVSSKEQADRNFRPSSKLLIKFLPAPRRRIQLLQPGGSCRDDNPRIICAATDLGIATAIQRGGEQTQIKRSKESHKTARFFIWSMSMMDLLKRKRTNTDRRQVQCQHFAFPPTTTISGHVAPLEWICAGQKIFPAMLDAIAGAHNSVRLEKYITQTESWGGLLPMPFLAAAKQVVHVSVLVDDFGSWSLPVNYFDPLIAAGALVAISTV